MFAMVSGGGNGTRAAISSHWSMFLQLPFALRRLRISSFYIIQLPSLFIRDIEYTTACGYDTVMLAR
jgi:hypothetical protein